MVEFEFDERGDEDIRNFVFQALGAGSMCWNPKPGDQVFDSERAIAIGEALMLKIEDYKNGLLAN